MNPETWGDFAAWGSVAIATATGCIATWQAKIARSQARSARKQAVAALNQAADAGRQANAAEAQVELTRAQFKATQESHQEYKAEQQIHLAYEFRKYVIRIHTALAALSKLANLADTKATGSIRETLRDISTALSDSLDLSAQIMDGEFFPNVKDSWGAAVNEMSSFKYDLAKFPEKEAVDELTRISDETRKKTGQVLEGLDNWVSSVKDQVRATAQPDQPSPDQARSENQLD